MVTFRKSIRHYVGVSEKEEEGKKKNILFLKYLLFLHKLPELKVSGQLKSKLRKSGKFWSI